MNRTHYWVIWVKGTDFPMWCRTKRKIHRYASKAAAQRDIETFTNPKRDREHHNRYEPRHFPNTEIREMEQQLRPEETTRSTA